MAGLQEIGKPIIVGWVGMYMCGGIALKYHSQELRKQHTKTKINEDIETLYNTVKQLDLIDLYETLQQGQYICYFQMHMKHYQD